jgi:hypothetical protein
VSASVLRLVDPGADVSAVRRWIGSAAYAHYGACSTCMRVRTEAGDYLYVVKQARSRRGFECFSCYRERTRPRPRRRKATQPSPQLVLGEATS